jgi:hypothetical protein
MLPAGGALWAITCFFNPAGYARRLRNYRVFRRALGVPLVTVELAHGNAFELQPGDAEVLVQIRGRSVLWQKERLLNVAQQHLPERCQAVAWIDCDLVLERPDWPERARRLLEERPLVQLFDTLYDLPRGVMPAEVDLAATPPTARSFAHRMSTGSISGDDLRPPSSQHVRACSFGMGWAARRELLQAHGFYDALILGSGDRAMACAAYGLFGDAIYTIRLDERRAAHYLRWAEPFFDRVRGAVGYVDGGLYHLWHGDVGDRRYLERHQDLSRLGFDPLTDIALSDGGCWRWSSYKPELHAYLNQYFLSRREDGPDGAGARTSTAPRFSGGRV